MDAYAIGYQLGLSKAAKYDGRKGPNYKALDKGRVKLTPEERDLVIKREATWNHGQDGAPSPAVWKSVVKDKTWYVTNTHRAFNKAPTLKGAISRYHKFIKSTS